ncbi:hypothetical protein WAX74_08790 [Psychrobacillus sp. FJAT-51614]|uniref:Uncharacterized protein n=1 Tax=Psychrobacillus mangrovi TaxID=3117745 RepID=A0ABU8F402_9BACI
MKESKVQLFPLTLSKDNNQSTFTQNPRLELMEEQKTLNLHLMKSVADLELSYQKILEGMQKQEEVLNIQGKNQRKQFESLKKSLLEITKTSKSYKSSMNEHLGKQTAFNKMIIRRSSIQNEVLNRIQRNSDKQESIIKRYFKAVLDKLDKNEVNTAKYTERLKALEQSNEQILAKIELHATHGSLQNESLPQHPMKIDTIQLKN